MASLADLSDLQNSWSSNCSDKHFPKFCPQSTGPYHTLILLETPGSEARDGKVSMFNKDDTARELCRLVNIAFNEDKRSGVLLWNAIPWVLDDKRQPKISDVI